MFDDQTIKSFPPVQRLRDTDPASGEVSVSGRFEDVRTVVRELRDAGVERPAAEVFRAIFGRTEEKPEGESAFNYGVASGDPDAESVVLWTHALPVDTADGAPVVVSWEVATDADFKQVVDRGLGVAGAEDDYTFKAIADGLEAGGEYYYRFKVDGELSDVGMTRTLPEGEVDSVTFAVFSCANYPAGYFNAYAEAVENGFDYSIHLGDYIYEYGVGEYATENAEALGRLPSPETEIVTFDDYSARYAQYTSDADLQALRAAAPMIMMWDDHETANDSWATGAQNHNDTDPDAPEFGVPWEDRRDDALEAYYLWNPIREPEDDLRNNDKTYAFGDLVDLHMPETRLQGRDETRADILSATATKVDTYLTGGFRGAQEFIADAGAAGIGAPVAGALLAAGRAAAEAGNAAGVAAFTTAASLPAISGLVAEAQDPERDMLGDAQMDELLGKIEASDATWQIIGSQTLMGRMELPAEVLVRLAELTPLFIDSALGTLSQEDAALLASFDEQFEVPYNFDSWDGYQAERQEILEALSASGSGGIVLAGDTHNAWTSNIFLEPEGADRTLAAVEFGGPGVTSPGFEEFLPEVPDPANPGEALDVAAEVFLQYVDDLVFANLRDRGYMSVEVTPDQVTTDYVFVSTTQSRDYTTEIVTQTALLDDFAIA